MITVHPLLFDIAKIAESGQCFRLNETAENTWTLVALGKVLRIVKRENGDYDFSCGRSEFDAVWKHYFDLDTDYENYYAKIPASDRFLTKAARYSSGIRILNQDPWEMLITFIISQRKSIPAIRTSVEKLCERYGNRIRYRKEIFYSFPSPEKLARAGTDGILACSVGYRAPYLYHASRAVFSGELDLKRIGGLGDGELKEVLLSLYGVGIKVANCVMLFGYHRINAFPVDVWMERMISEHYRGLFPAEKYEGFAGIVQQFIFFYGRTYAGTRKLDKRAALR